MCRALHQAGIEILQVISRDIRKAEELAAPIKAEPLSTPAQINIIPDLFLVCVSDDALEKALQDYTQFDAVVAHTSGSTGMEVFRSAYTRYGVFYPLQTFTRGREMAYGDIPFLVEGSTPGVTKQIANLASRISGTVEVTTSAMRRQIHIAAVFACNFSNHLSAIAADILASEGLSLELLNPLQAETFRKLQHMHPIEAQTGPAVRQDNRIINAHLNALSDRPEDAKLYRALTDSIIRVTRKNDE